MDLVRFSIRNPLLTNLLLAVVLVAGVVAWHAMPQEMFPVVDLDRVRITTLYEGAAPEEVERQIAIPIEDEFDGLADIDVITSSSLEGRGTVTIELKPGTDVDDFMRDARTALDRVIPDLPEDAERPELERMETRFPVISMALYGEVARHHLYDVAERVKHRLLNISGVASAGLAGTRDWELWVIVDPEAMAVRQVSLAQVTEALRGNLEDLPGGSIEAQEGDILLRGMGVTPDPERVADVPLRSNPQGGVLRLGEIAEVERRFEEAQTLGRFNGQPSVNITITKTADASTIEVAHRVKALAAELERTLPAGMGAGTFSDLSMYVEKRLETVMSSALVGLALVLLSLYLFLNFRVALVTAIGIPVSFLVATIIIHATGYTVNMVSLFAYLIALGMIVDDAIIVTENVYRHMENGLPAAEAASVGAKEVMGPVVASTLTTVSAFLPMLAVGGTMGTFIAVIPVVVSACLLGSLWQAFGVLPSHTTHLLKVMPKGRGRLSWDRLLNTYSHIVRWSVVNRYFVTLATVGAFVLVVAFALTRMPFQLFGDVDAGQFFINAEAPNTYGLADSDQLATRMEEAVRRAVEEDKELKSLLTNVGVTFIDFNTIKFGSNYVQLMVDLRQRQPEGFIERFVSPVVSLDFTWQGTRTRSTAAVINAIREELVQLPAIQRMSILKPQGGPQGADIEIGVTGPRVDVLGELGGQVSDYLQRLPGVFDVRQDLEPGKLEYRYTLNDRGRQLGLTQQTLAQAVRTGYQGTEVMHVSWRDERIPVRVIYPQGTRDRVEALQNLRITLADGRSVFLADVADVEIARGYSVVNRRNSQRLVTLTAEVDSETTTALEVNDAVRDRFAHWQQAHPEYDMLSLGEKREAAESIADMIRALAIALALIFFILVWLFRSLLDPLVVMFAIPFGAIGVVIGHLLMGYHLEFLSLIGFLALAGILVNDSLILVEFAKRMRWDGWERLEAVIEAGRIRARPIVLTSVTTFLGISPLIFFATGQTAFLAPMAISLGFGLLFATVLILVAVPCFYIIMDDLRGWTLARLARGTA